MTVERSLKYVEHTVVRHLDPIRDRARRVIRQHRFVIKGLERYPGVLSRNIPRTGAKKSSSASHETVRPSVTRLQSFAEDRRPVDIAEIDRQIGAVRVDVHLAEELHAAEDRKSVV